jgi:PilZ domain-containing protein
MKHRKRKSKPAPDSQPVDQVTTHEETQNLANPPELQVEVQSSETYIELQSEMESFERTVEDQTGPENPPGPIASPGSSQQPASSFPAQAELDRRTHPRYAFTATAEVVGTESGARTKARVRDLSQQGCYLDTDKPLPLGTATDVRITKGKKSLEVQGRVVYVQPGRGMGLMFTAVKPEHGGTLDAWIAESRETSWLAANRRRSQRVLMKIPVRVSVQAGAASVSEEETHTLAVSAHGALLVVTAPMYRGQRLTLLNPQTKDSLECVVAHIDRFPNEQMKVGVEFLLPNPTFWHVAFPPKDWSPRHPDAKSRAK